MSARRPLSGAVGGVVLTVVAAAASPVATAARLAVTVVGPEGNPPAAAVWVAAVDLAAGEGTVARKEALRPGRSRTVRELPRGRYQVPCAGQGQGW